MFSKTKTFTALLSFAVITLVMALITFPKEAVTASARGLDIWWGTVFPSLLPFFIMSNVMVSIGVVQFFSVLFEPFMRPLFKVPGSGGVVWAMSMASGFPSGAKMTTELRQENLLTQTEAERLVSFTNASNPLFIIGAVAVGFFHEPALGIILAAAHYGGNFFVGLIMRFYKAEDAKPFEFKWPSLREAFRSLHNHRIKQYKPLGALLGDAVITSVQTLLMIGGFIILFSVLNELLSVLHIATTASSIVALILELLFLPPELSKSIVSGIFEITLGAQLVSETTVELQYQIIVVSFILAFSGLSVHAQVASILAKANIRYTPFLAARFMHGLISAALALAIFNLAEPYPKTTVAIADNSFTIDKSVHHLFEWGPLFTIVMLLVYCWSYARANRVFNG
ncbi:sporulation integral membrane protein YlbJ [Bacillaceae bacterium SIJ1]|uniref:sporulation integral membrane protein YlbJ n=1 Tax=Litoribacterium kuwaitense TaxID=1398745 RepID=UPI0013ECE8B8|nr:sporulation integral membrane protein YlbJ [Litoribacterium kuwaitense]NGP44359.1 sporulation integral membrane protein YlbJ [Litoribacterium kuwaitense]